MIDKLSGMFRSDWQSRLLGRPVYILSDESAASLSATSLGEILAPLDTMALVRTVLPMRQVAKAEALVRAGFYAVASEVTLLCHRAKFRATTPLQPYRLRRGSLFDIVHLPRSFDIDDPLLVDENLQTIDTAALIQAVFDQGVRAKEGFFVIEDVTAQTLHAAGLVRGGDDNMQFLHCRRRLDDLEGWNALVTQLTARHFDTGSATVQLAIPSTQTRQLNTALSLGYLVRETRMYYHWTR